ncbi:hypothetical protein KUTeg_017214, partial [Tegillarca granosa]
MDSDLDPLQVSSERATQNPVFFDASPCEASIESADSSEMKSSTTEDITSTTWRSFHITVSNKEQSVEKEQTMCLQPVKMQYLLQNKLIEVQKLLNSKKMKIEKVCQEKVVISLIDNKLMLEEGLVEIVECLENMAKDISAKMFPISNTKIRMCVITEVTKQLPRLLDASTSEDLTIDIRKKMLIFENASEADIVKYEEKIKKKYIKCFIHVGKQRTVVFYTLSAMEGKEVFVAMSSLQTIHLAEDLMHFKEISSRTVGPNKACITTTSNKGIFEITTTNDLTVEILTEVERITTDVNLADIIHLPSAKMGPYPDIVQYQVDERLTIHLYKADLESFDQAEAIVLPIYGNDSLTKNRILETIVLNELSNKQLQSVLQTMKIGDVKIGSLKEEMNWTHVLFEKASNNSKDIERLEYDLKIATENGLNEAVKLKLKSIAVQIDLMGKKIFRFLDKRNWNTKSSYCIKNELVWIIVAFCRALVDAIWGIINKEPKKCDLEIWIVTTNEAVLDTFEKMLDIGDGSKLTNTKPDLGSSKLENQKTDDKTLDEDCCICMDKITDPKWLPCKHVFCTDCIDQQFKFKPACPQCGAVHGIVTGDQPPGTISRKKLYFSLPGYPEYQTIAITYTFSSGYQS